MYVCSLLVYHPSSFYVHQRYYNKCTSLKKLIAVWKSLRSQSKIVYYRVAMITCMSDMRVIPRRALPLSPVSLRTRPCHFHCPEGLVARVNSYNTRNPSWMRQWIWRDMKAWPNITEVGRWPQWCVESSPRRKHAALFPRIWFACGLCRVRGLIWRVNGKWKKRFARVKTLSLDSGFARKRTTAQLGQSTTSGKR